MEPSTSSSPLQVVVIGAGVIGLQTCLTLLSDDSTAQGFAVTLLSAAWPGTLSDPLYTSMFSGAQWRSNPPLSDHQQQAWDRVTLRHWQRLIAKHPPAELGLEQREALFLWDKKPDHPAAQEHWWSISGDMPIEELTPDEAAACGGFEAGFRYNTIAVNPIVYCQWLLRQCEAKGLRKRTARVGSLQDALDLEPNARVLVNCAGVEAGRLVGDDECFPTKGQTILIRGQAHRLVTRRNTSGGEPWEALVIPRPGEDITMLGGCKLPGDWDTKPDDAITEMILRRCRPLVPELLNPQGEFDIIAVKVGLRPSRVSGPRLAVEKTQSGHIIVHNYGHHSAGFEGSVGAANSVVTLLKHHLKS